MCIVEGHVSRVFTGSSVKKSKKASHFMQNGMEVDFRVQQHSVGTFNEQMPAHNARNRLNNWLSIRNWGWHDGNGRQWAWANPSCRWSHDNAEPVM
jgi:hypothetical protein